MNVTRPSVFWIATLAVVAAIVVLLRDILLPFVAGIALAYLLDPVVERIERLGVNRTIATLGIVGLFIIGVGGVMVQVTPLLGTEVADFIEKVPKYIEKLQAFANNPGRPWLRKIIGEGLSEAEQSSGQLTSVATDWIPTFLRSLWSDSRALMSILSLMVVTPIVTIYLLMDWKRLIAAIDSLIPAAQHETVLALSGELNDTISGFLRGQGTICLVLALYYASALRLTGLNHGILIGLAAGLISFIPYLGSLTGLVLSLCVVVAPVLAGLDDDSGRARNLPRRAGDRRLCAGSLSHRVASPAQSRLDYVRDCRVRLSFWLRRLAYRGAARRRDRRRHPVCDAAISGKPARAGGRAGDRCQRAGTFGQKDQLLATLARENLIFRPKST